MRFLQEISFQSLPLHALHFFIFQEIKTETITQTQASAALALFSAFIKLGLEAVLLRSLFKTEFHGVIGKWGTLRRSLNRREEVFIESQTKTNSFEF